MDIKYYVGYIPQFIASGSEKEKQSLQNMLKAYYGTGYVKEVSFEEYEKIRNVME